MPFTRLMFVGATCHQEVVQDGEAAQLGLILHRHCRRTMMTNISGCRVDLFHWNGEVPRPDNLPIAVTRPLAPGDIIAFDHDLIYEYRRGPRPSHH